MDVPSDVTTGNFSTTDSAGKVCHNLVRSEENDVEGNHYGSDAVIAH
jgi:hypothetical protein